MAMFEMDKTTLEFLMGAYNLLGVAREEGAEFIETTATLIKPHIRIEYKAVISEDKKLLTLYINDKKQCSFKTEYLQKKWEQWSANA